MSGLTIPVSGIEFRGGNGTNKLHAGALEGCVKVSEEDGQTFPAHK